MKIKVLKANVISILNNRLENRFIDSNKFIGVDECLDTSLFEYRFIVSKDTHKDSSGTYMFIYEDTNYFETTQKFSFAHLSHEDINDMFFDWVDKVAFLDYTDSTEKEFLSDSIVNKVSNLISYYTIEDIFGSSYGMRSGKLQTIRFINNYNN